MKIVQTNVYKVNGKLVVADSVKEAIDIYNTYYEDIYVTPPIIKSVNIVGDDDIPQSYYALLSQNEDNCK